MKAVGLWLVNVSVSELMNIHRAGCCSRSGGKFKRRGLHRVAAELLCSIITPISSSARPGSSVDLYSGQLKAQCAINRDKGLGSTKFSGKTINTVAMARFIISMALV